MSYKYKHKKKSVHLEDQVHRELKMKAMDDNISLERITNRYLKEKIKAMKLKNEK